MAELTTTVHSPIGPVTKLPGRVPRASAADKARQIVREQIAALEAHLSEYDNWTTTCERGSIRAKTFEEMPWAGPSS